MKSKNLMFVVLLLVLAAVAGAVYYFMFSKTVAEKVEDAATGDVIEFSAELTDYDDSCAADAQCSAQFDDVKVVTNPGFVVGPVTIGTNDANSDKVGSKFEVKAEKSEDGSLTIVGDESLFVKLAE
jgi:hypothetical protein